MALRLTRKEGQGFVLKLEPTITEAELQQLLTEGFHISVANVGRINVTIAIDAPLGVNVVRDELLESITEEAD